MTASPAVLAAPDVVDERVEAALLGHERLHLRGLQVIDLDRRPRRPPPAPLSQAR